MPVKVTFSPYVKTIPEGVVIVYPGVSEMYAIAWLVAGKGPIQERVKQSVKSA